MSGVSWASCGASSRGPKFARTSRKHLKTTKAAVEDMTIREFVQFLIIAFGEAPQNVVFHH